MSEAELEKKIDHLTDLVDGLAISMAHGFDELRQEMKHDVGEVKQEIQTVKMVQVEQGQELGQIRRIVEGQTDRFDNADRRISRVEKHLNLKPFS